MKQKVSIELEPDMQTKKHGIVRDDHGQTQPADKQRAQQHRWKGPRHMRRMRMRRRPILNAILQRRRQGASPREGHFLTSLSRLASKLARGWNG
jgi:hypothetical protein